MQKNVANQKWVVFAFNRTTLVPLTGDAANITGNVRIDGGAVNAIDDVNPTELEDGFYVFDITAAESNGENIVIAPASSTADIQVIGVPSAIYTTPANFPDLSVVAATGRVDVDSVSGTQQTANDNGADLNDILVDTAEIGIAGAGLTNIDLPNQTMDITGNLSGSVGSVTAQVSADVTAISGDSVAADNLELDYDGTGFSKSNSSIGTCTINTDMRGTDGAATAAALTTHDNKIGTPVGADISTDIAAIPTTPMRGTDGANTTTPPTVTAITTDIDSNSTQLAKLGTPVIDISSDIASLNDISVSDILTTQMTEAYAADGTAPTLTQALFLILQQAGEFSISGTTITVKKIDGSTTAATFTIDDGTDPTSRTRSA